MLRLIHKAIASAILGASLAHISSAQSRANLTVQLLFQDLASWIQHQTPVCGNPDPQSVLVTGASVYGSDVENGNHVNYISGEFTSVSGNELKGEATIYYLPDLLEHKPAQYSFPMTLTLVDKDSATLEIFDGYGSGAADRAALSLINAFGGAPILLSGQGFTGSMSVAFSKVSSNRTCVH